VEPRFERLKEGRDPEAHIISVNVLRHSHTRSVVAMGYAMAFPTPVDADNDGTVDVADIKLPAKSCDADR
jgi:hypothetical protein